MNPQINGFDLLTKPALKYGFGRMPSDNDGFFMLIDKARDWTSFDVVNKLRRILKIKKAGHCGTLDPLATGLLIIAGGKATRAVSVLTDQDKTYETEFTLGISTDTYDTDGAVLMTKTVPDISADEWISILKEWTGAITQIPPSFSAIKKNGIPLYKLARKGKAVQADPRQVSVYKIDLIGWEKPVLSLRIHCSKGTYIRSIAHDIGERLGCGAAVSALRRTDIGNYSVREAWTIPEIQSWSENEKAEYAVH